MLRIDLCKTEHLGVGQFSAKLSFHLVEILDFLWTQCQSFLLVVFLQVLDVENRSRLDVHRKNVLVKTFVHALKHRVVLSVLTRHREVFLNALNTLDCHVLRNFHSIRTPRSNHFATWTYKKAIKCLRQFFFCLTIKPAKFRLLISCQFVIHTRSNHTLRWCSEKVNHSD